MEPKVDIFVFAPQMYFTGHEIIDAEERLGGFARVIHGNQDVCIYKPNTYVNNSYDPSENAYIISEIIKKIVEIHPDEIFIVDRAWDCTEVRLINEFARLANIKVVEFDIECVIPDAQKKMYSRAHSNESDACVADTGV